MVHRWEVFDINLNPVTQWTAEVSSDVSSCCTSSMFQYFCHLACRQDRLFTEQDTVL